MAIIVSDKNISVEVASFLRKVVEKQNQLQPLRKQALADFERIGLPTNKTEEYKYTPLSRLLEKNFSFAVDNASSTLTEVKNFFVPEVEGHVLVFINGVFSTQHSSDLADLKGMTILPIKEAIKSKGDVINNYIGKIADHSTDAFAAWNTASWTDGVLIQVADNNIIDKPILIHYIHDVQAGQVITSVRNLVLTGKNSEVTILEKHDSIGNNNGFSTVVTEGIVAENSGLNWYTIQNDSGNRYHFDLKQIQQSNSSRVNTFTFTLDGKAIRNNLQLSLDGQGIDSHMYGLYLLGKDTLADNHTVVDHKQPNSFSNELYKGVIDDNAKGVFNGKIYVRPNAQKTNAFQANRNILLSDKATVNTKPQLEIWADDVKCSHGCTSGQLDEEALFYLRTRGIHKDTAQAMMLYAFAVELLENIKNASLKTYIDALISERLHKNF